MQVKNIVRKAVVLGSAAGFVGMTMAGALAYDLSTYPAKFIVDGKFDGKIVVGEKASTSDVLGSIDIAASLQGASVSKVAIPGQAGQVAFSGDSFKIGTSSDQLELREAIGKVSESVTAQDLAGLKGGRIQTSEGATNYAQYLRLQDASSMQDIAVNFVKNSGEDNEKISDYMVVPTTGDKPFLEWEVQFDNGLKSKITDGDTDVQGELRDMEDRTINVMGTDYNIVNAKVTTSPTTPSFTMTLMGGSLSDTLREQETKTYSINGVPYEVTLVFVSDPASGTSGPQVKFSVNGEITQALGQGETDTLNGGLQIGVRDVLANPREGVASFYLGARKLLITDTNTQDNDYGTGSIEINNDDTESDVVQVSGSVTSSKYEITSIKYRVVMESKEGSAGVAYVPPGHGVRELMEKPELLLSDTLDIKYGGLTTPTVTKVTFDPSSDNEYDLSFTNLEGAKYTGVPLLSNDGTELKWGNSDNNLVFVEGADTAYPVADNDYFVVSSKTGADADRAVTNVLRYKGYDESSRTVTLQDLAGNSRIQTILDTTGNGTIKIGGHSYSIGIQDVAAKDANLKVDLDGNGSINSGAKAVFTTEGGFTFAPVLVAEVGNASNTATLVSTQNGTNTIGALLGGRGVVTFQGSVFGRNFDTNNDENFNWTVSEDSDDKLAIDFKSTTYSGPLTQSPGTVATKFTFAKEVSGSDVSVGMTDYGIKVSQDTRSDNPDILTFDVPAQQRLAQVFVTMGSVSQTTGGQGTSEKVNPIAVGLAVLDKDAETQGLYGKENLIIVGGPCANTIAAKFMNNPATCGEGFEQGKATISSKEMNGKVAILVAGYESTETLGASRVLADYKAWGSKLKGDQVEVVVADLSSLDVKPQGAKTTTPTTNTTTNTTQ